MTLFLILAPYAAFALLMLVTSAAVSLFTAAAICLAVIAYDLAGGRSMKILGAGSVVVFTAVGSYVSLIDPHLGVSAVKFAVDTGIFLVTLGSIVIGKPFTLQWQRVSRCRAAEGAGILRATTSSPGRGRCRCY
jgi:hypothetical protein